MPKTDLEQLKGILEEFDDETITEVLLGRELTVEKLEKPIMKKIKDFPKFKKGRKARVGTKGVVARTEYLEIKPLERLIDEGEFLPVHFLEEGATVQKAVARVRVPGYWYGSGFLVSKSLFMTNNHVLPTENIAGKGKYEFNYQLDFQGNIVETDTYDGNPDSFFHTNAALDYTIVRLKSKPLFKFYPYPLKAVLRRYTLSTEQIQEASYGPEMAEVGGPEFLWKLYKNAGDVWGHLNLSDTVMAVDNRVSVIQHPATRRKEVCLHDNRITEIYTNVVHYRTDTEPGSSGSPVFDNEWELLAIHHAAGDMHAGNWLDNEGIRIDRIIDDLQSNLRGTSEAGILTELGIP